MALRVRATERAQVLAPPTAVRREIRGPAFETMFDSLLGYYATSRCLYPLSRGKLMAGEIL
jgi:hypothetical protein